MALLRLYANSPARPSLTIVNGLTPTGYALRMDGLDLGNAAWEHSYSGPRGTQGSRPSNGTPQNRPASFPIGIAQAASKDVMYQRISALEEIVDDMRRFGGRILWQSTFQSARQFYEVLLAGMADPEWTQRSETNFYFVNTLNAVCGPYLSGDPMDTLDAFDVDSSADYTASTGTSGTIAVAGGSLTPSSTGVKIFRHTGKGYAFGDVQVTMDLTTAGTVTSGVWGAAICMDTAGSDTGFVAELVAASNVLAIAKYVAGSRTSLATVASTPLASTRYFVRGRREGNVITAELFTTAPTPVATPAATVSYTLTAAEAGRFVTGNAGFRWTPASTSETLNELDIEPYTYRLISMPEQVRLGGIVPGDVSAIADILVTPQGGAATPIWGTVAWSERPQVTNLCWNGDLESSTIGTGGWFIAAAGALTAGATSVARSTTAARNKYGGANLQIVCPATINSSAYFFLPWRFKKGRQYAAFCWASSAAGTTSAGMKLGAVADFGTGGASALTATPQLYAVTWVPTADATSVAVTMGILAATATTLNLDGMCVVEVPSIALSAGINASVTTGTVYALPTEIPNLQADGSLSAPFLALIDAELIRVTSVTAAGVLTFDRAAEGSTAAAHSADAMVIICPPGRSQFEGKGAAPAFGAIECESYIAALSSVSGGSLANFSDANARGALDLTWTPATSGAQTASIVYLVDPSTLFPDDYTQGEVDVEVWIREAWSTSLTSLRVTASAQPESGTTAGPERFTREYGNVGKLIPPASAKAARFHRLGTIPMIADPANPQRWRLKLGLSCVGGASPSWDMDYLLLLPTRARTPWVTGKANDTASATGAVPAFVPYDGSWTTTSAMTKRLRSDGSSVVSIPGGYGWPDQGPGKPIEIPDVNCDLIVKLSTLIPDDPTLDSTAEATANLTTSVHCAVTPRYAIGRGA